MIKVKEVDSKEELQHCFEIRKTVFVFEQNVPEEEEYDEFESVSRHFLAFKDNLPVGTARFRQTQNGVKLERFAVLKKGRLFGAGSALLSRILNEVQKQSFTGLVYLHAQVQAEPFYKKHGFKAQGELFYECEIPHHTMVWMPD